MTEPFRRKVTVRCSVCRAEIQRQIGTVFATLRQGRRIFCENCWPDRKRELDRAYRARRRSRS